MIYTIYILRELGGIPRKFIFRRKQGEIIRKKSYGFFWCERYLYTAKMIFHSNSFRFIYLI